MALPASKRRRRLASQPRAVRRRPVEREASRLRIHRAAQRLFARYGYDAVSLQHIADEVGLHKSTLFHHYESKLQILDEVLNESIEQAVGWVATLRAQDPPDLERFFVAIDELVDYFSEQPEAARLLVSALTSPPDSDLAQAGSAERVVEFYAGVADWLERARQGGVIRRISIRQTIPMLMGLVLFYPAIVGDQMLVGLMGKEPFSARAREIRKSEIRAMLSGLLAP
jgi:AcrR family transcriptional regulator